jgi:hypothetical protein
VLSTATGGDSRWQPPRYRDRLPDHASLTCFDAIKTPLHENLEVGPDERYADHMRIEYSSNMDTTAAQKRRSPVSSQLVADLVPYGWRITLTVLAVVLPLYALFGCGSTEGGVAPPSTDRTAKKDEPLPDSRPDISGTITDVQTIYYANSHSQAKEDDDPDRPVSSGERRGDSSQDNSSEILPGDMLGTVLIEGPNEESGSLEDRVTVMNDTKLLKREGEGLRAIGFEDLKVGQRADAWYEGPVAESHPRQATASAIVIENGRG